MDEMVYHQPGGGSYRLLGPMEDVNVTTGGESRKGAQYHTGRSGHRPARDEGEATAALDELDGD